MLSSIFTVTIVYRLAVAIVIPSIIGAITADKIGKKLQQIQSDAYYTWMVEQTMFRHKAEIIQFTKEEVS